VVTPLEEIAKHLIVEHHKDHLSRAHVFGYSTHPFVRKSSDLVKSADSPAFEVKDKCFAGDTNIRKFG
jgi:hypothetical protein